MAIKKILIPTTPITLPISKVEAKIRPYTTGEQKTLLLTSKENQSAVANSVLNLIHVCSEGTLSKKKLSELPFQDIFYIFTQLNVQSTGSEKRVKLPCSNKDCGIDIPVIINAANAQLDKTEYDTMVKFNDTSGVKMRLPNLEISLRMTSIKNSTEGLDEFNAIVSCIADCIETIIIDDDIQNASDNSHKDVVEWVESLPSTYFTKLADWIKGMPTIQNVVNYKCGKCGTEHQTVIKDLDSFFE